MEFETVIEGKTYSVSSLRNNSFLISGPDTQYILVKGQGWHCADDIPARMLSNFGRAIDDYLSARS
ncbi:MAG TPA: hypothetical protein VFR58_01155 [Flavisolibacter sp.]|nr:hypothetical protein [Flavisolibacter sp.]